MTEVIEGNLLIHDRQIAIVVARWNDLITSRLLAGAIDTFKRHGLSEENITVVHVPGSFEIPLAAQALASQEKYAGVCCLGAVIQGETSHHEYINQPAAASLMQIGLKHNKPVTFGVLTCSNMDQAIDRAGGKAGNKGQEAALAMIEMANVLDQIK
ncbi:6,7-dimethyl-8-ribityllumazine synthase [Polystyrenella longa]|uniref:6,7-dimethyl-8-ribityllumazine synthase n=1 Tax=Polystyrenella longa TaxID=2528007 RepID=A0A518CQM5_9PLAN|nr:6,7-dimethyl-8-ribityllumazine synthase [Polystyrenella longa]QDU81528.1 6,7-dimethyl-8-ribityllumazine synthase [Polystyrenella longa]